MTAASTGPRRAIRNGRRSRHGRAARRCKLPCRRRRSRRASSRPTAPATTSTSSTRRRTRSSARSAESRSGTAPRLPRRPLDLRQQRSRQHARRRRRANAARHVERAAHGPPEQHFDQPRRSPRLRRDPAGAGRRRRHRHADAHAREEHPDRGRRAQHLRDARRPLRDRGLDRRQNGDRDRPTHRGAGVGHAFRSRRPADGFRAKRRWLDQAHVRAADGAQRLRGHRFRDAHRGGTHRAAETGARQGARLRRRQRLARHGRVGRQHAARRRQPAEQRRVRVFAAGPQAPRRRSTSASRPTG